MSCTRQRAFTRGTSGSVVSLVLSRSWCGGCCRNASSPGGGPGARTTLDGVVVLASQGSHEGERAAGGNGHTHTHVGVSRTGMGQLRMSFCSQAELCGTTSEEGAAVGRGSDDISAVRDAVGSAGVCGGRSHGGRRRVGSKTETLACASLRSRLRLFVLCLLRRRLARDRAPRPCRAAPSATPRNRRRRAERTPGKRRPDTDGLPRRKSHGMRKEPLGAADVRAAA